MANIRNQVAIAGMKADSSARCLSNAAKNAVRENAVLAMMLSQLSAQQLAVAVKLAEIKAVMQ